MQKEYRLLKTKLSFNEPKLLKNYQVKVQIKFYKSNAIEMYPQ